MTPKAFISYAWTSDEHKAWVLGLADDLLASGTEVVLDRYDLHEGHDAHAFMEGMVTEPTVTKVILICDKAYAEKADRRAGGVGAEAQIITPELYGKKDQNRFVAVIREKDGDGKPYVPTYYKSRIHIDLSDEATHAEEFERLVRWAFGKPLLKKPALGKPPAYLDEGEGIIKLGTSPGLKRAVDALKADRPNAESVVSDCLDTLASELEKFRLKKATKHVDDEVVRNIEAFLPYRNKALVLFTTIATYRNTPEIRCVVHRFFERLIPYMDRPAEVTQWSDWDFDNFRFIAHELLLYAVAVLIRAERFDFAGHLLNSEYYVAGESDYGRNTMVPFTVFWTHMRSLEIRNGRLNLNRFSIRADLLHERAKGSGVEFRHVMQADFVMYLRSVFGQDGQWWPVTLMFWDRFGFAFEVFARAQSKAYFGRIMPLLKVTGPEQFKAAVSGVESDPNRLPSWGFHRFSPKRLSGADLLASKP